MAEEHKYGIKSDKEDFFYYNKNKDQWFRLLVRGGETQGYLKEIAIAITPPGGFITVGDALDIAREFIYISDATHSDPNGIYTHVLPYAVYESAIKHLGLKLTRKIIDCGYINLINLQKLLESKKGDYCANLLLKEPNFDRIKPILEKTPGYFKNRVSHLGEISYV